MEVVYVEEGDGRGKDRSKGIYTGDRNRWKSCTFELREVKGR